MKRFEKTKGFVMGVAVCLLVSTMLTPAFAESATKQLNAYFNNIKVVLNGTELTPKDANGNSVEPFVVNGTTYLPIRAVSEALGLAVEWDGTTQTVILGSNEKTRQPSIWLKDMNQLVNTWNSNSNGLKTSVKDNLGNSYDNYLYGANDKEGITYALNSQYSKFTGTFILREDKKSMSTIVRLAIYLDDKLAYTSENVTAGTFPIDFTVNTTGAVRMRVAIQQDTGDGDFIDNTWFDVAAIVNAGLWK